MRPIIRTAEKSIKEGIGAKFWLRIVDNQKN